MLILYSRNCYVSLTYYVRAKKVSQPRPEHRDRDNTSRRTNQHGKKRGKNVHLDEGPEWDEYQAAIVDSLTNP